MIEELHPGDRQISAASWNEMRAAIQGITPAQQQYQSGKLNPVYITIKNVTGSDLPAFSAVKLTTPTYINYRNTSSLFLDAALTYGVEMDGDTPTDKHDTIAIIQEACPAGGVAKAIVSGVTPVKMVLSNVSPNVHPCLFAEAVPNANHVLATNDVTPIRLLYAAAGYGYAIIDYVDDRERFKITCTASNELASKAKKGAVFTIARGANKRCLAVCQEDVPDDFVGDYYMPYYTPEQNYGVIPNELDGGIHSSGNIVSRRGVGSGDYAFSVKRLDYAYQRGTYTYEPKFVYTGIAVDRGSGESPRVGIKIEGHVYPVGFPTNYNYAGASLTSYPDVYAGDQITVLVEERYTGDYGATVTAIEYPTDFEKGSSIVVEDTMLLGRGWDEDYIPDTNFKYAIKVQGNSLT